MIIRIKNILHFKKQFNYPKHTKMNHLYFFEIIKWIFKNNILLKFKALPIKTKPTLHCLLIILLKPFNQFY